jgi:hypothetical protein
MGSYAHTGLCLKVLMILKQGVMRMLNENGEKWYISDVRPTNVSVCICTCVSNTLTKYYAIGIGIATKARVKINGEICVQLLRKLDIKCTCVDFALKSDDVRSVLNQQGLQEEARTVTPRSGGKWVGFRPSDSWRSRYLGTKTSQSIRRTRWRPGFC